MLPAASYVSLLLPDCFAKVTLNDCVALPAGSATYRRQLTQEQVINFVGKLISGDADGAGRAIAQLSTSKDVAGIASALTNAASLVSPQTQR